jgi:hypothetical protein
MGLAVHAVESKAVVRIEAAVSPRPCLGCAVELGLCVALLRRGVLLSRASTPSAPPDIIYILIIYYAEMQICR